MKKIIYLSLLLCLASICWGQSVLTCSLPPGGPSHGTLASCSLSAIPVNGCIRYDVRLNIGGGLFTGTINANLNSSVVQSVSLPLAGNILTLKGAICNNASQQSQWTIFDPAAIDYGLSGAAPFSSSATLVEDLSLASTFSISATTQRGFGVGFVGGTIEVLQP